MGVLNCTRVRLAIICEIDVYVNNMVAILFPDSFSMLV